MAKPICVIYLPSELSLSAGGKIITPNDLMSILNGWDDEVLQDRKHFWSDYLWFSFYKHEIDAPEFKVFHEKDFTEIQYEELKKLVLDSINQLKP